jgi:hypothetical protein
LSSQQPRLGKSAKTVYRHLQTLPAQRGAMAAQCRVLFSDVDGTLVHYRDALSQHGALHASEADSLEDSFTPQARVARCCLAVGVPPKFRC